MGRGYLDYEKLFQDALQGVVRGALAEVAERGLIGNHHFLITFRTDHPGVDIPAFLRNQYPEEMTIVLQNQFSGLSVSAEGFSVSLSFNKVPAGLTVPFAALVRFVDPSAKFGLQLTPVTPAGELMGPPAASSASGGPGTAPAPEHGAAAEGGSASEKVVTLDSFRKQ